MNMNIRLTLDISLDEDISADVSTTDRRNSLCYKEYQNIEAISATRTSLILRKEKAEKDYIFNLEDIYLIEIRYEKEDKFIKDTKCWIESNNIKKKLINIMLKNCDNSYMRHIWSIRGYLLPLSVIYSFDTENKIDTDRFVSIFTEVFKKDKNFKEEIVDHYFITLIPQCNIRYANSMAL